MLTTILNEYLRHASIPVLELRFDDAANTVSYRWNAEEKDFAMPVRVGQKDHWQIIYPTTSEWKTLSSSVKKNDFDVATDLYYINVSKQ